MVRQRLYWTLPLVLCGLITMLVATIQAEEMGEQHLPFILQSGAPEATPSFTPTPTPTPDSTATPVTMMGAGDIACAPDNKRFNGGEGTATECRQRATSDLLAEADIVFTLGDNQYEDAEYDEFMGSYDPSWGRFRAVTRPAAGNRDYRKEGAPGYYAYFGEAAGDPGKGYYDYHAGDWHVIVLNSMCWRVGGCNAEEPQYQWLKGVLETTSARCRLAYWHHAIFSSNSRGGNEDMRVYFELLYEHGTEVVLVAHDHYYERFAPQDPEGNLDLERGIRQFTVGTGGNDLYEMPASPAPNSEARNDDAYGVLRLDLYPARYEWQFVPEAGKQYTDEGEDSCR